MRLLLLGTILSFCLSIKNGLAQNLQTDDTPKHQCVLMGHVLDDTYKNPIAGAKVSIFNEITGNVDTLITAEDGLYIFNLTCNEYFVIHAQTTDSLSKSELMPIVSNMASNIQYKNLWIDLPDASSPLANASHSPIDASSRSFSVPHLTDDQAIDFAKHLTFSVEIGVFSRIPDSESSFITPIKEDLMIESLANGDHRLTVGVFSTYPEIAPFFEQIRRKGYQGARIIAYWGSFYVAVPLNDLLLFIEK